jgi:hypothetical protein
LVEFLLDTSETLLCSTSAPPPPSLLDAIQLLMLFVGTVTYLEPRLFLLILFHNVSFLIIKLLIVLIINVCIYFFSYCVMIGVIPLLELLEFPKRYNTSRKVLSFVGSVCLFFSLARAHFIIGLWATAEPRD